MKYLKTYAPVVLRTGMALVVLWFAIEQFMNTALWTSYIPESIVSLSRLSATTLVYLNASFEAIFGVLLLLGWKTRWVALLLALHLFHITWVVGYGEIGVRDFGLAMATLSIFMNGSDLLCIDDQEESMMSSVAETSVTKRTI